MLLMVLTLLALTRAEIVQRMRAPVVTQADGLVRVYADCPEDMRREYQSPVARHAAETVRALYGANKLPSRRFERAEIVVHLGSVRTNLTDVVTRVTTNELGLTTRIYLKSPGHADLERFRLEVARAFHRSVLKREITPEEAREALISADPAARIARTRAQLEAWLAGDRSAQGAVDDETWDERHIALMRKVIEVGVSSRRDVQTFASRLFLYPWSFDDTFSDGSRVITFAEAIELSKRDWRVRVIALRKAMEVAVFGAGRSPELAAASLAYVEFLKDLGKGEKTAAELEEMLLNADKRLTLSWESAK